MDAVTGIRHVKMTVLIRKDLVHVDEIDASVLADALQLRVVFGNLSVDVHRTVAGRRIRFAGHGNDRLHGNSGVRQLFSDQIKQLLIPIEERLS